MKYDELIELEDVLELEYNLLSYFNYYLDKYGLKENIGLYSTYRKQNVFDYWFEIYPTLHRLHFTNFHFYIRWEIDDQYGNIKSFGKFEEVDGMDKEIIYMISCIKEIINE